MIHDQVNFCPSPSSPYESKSFPCLSPLPLFSDARHQEYTEEPEYRKGQWRVKERMKTFSVVLVICLNPGVEPPDCVKPKHSAKLECWIDPLSSNKAVETIGQALQRQYERWQPKARFKISIEPTTDEVKKLCISLRKQAQDDRVLFHYNGHGVPKPTNNGEIWIFNKDYTQYIPLSIYDLLLWMGTPSVFVWDCGHAQQVIRSYNKFAQQRQEDQAKYGTGIAQVPDFEANSIHLAACSDNQLLPIDPDMPADLFTATLTMPIKVSILSFSTNNKHLIPWAANVTLEKIDALPGKIADRRSLVGELNWVFTAITDTIAWTTLSRDLFLRLFRQDLLVASLFRNFLFADRLMRHYGCVPISHPPLPPTYKHHLWLSWESTLNSLLKEMALYQDSAYPNPLLRSHSTEFFTEQIKCFSSCLRACSYSPEAALPPEQLPILLQVLLSKAERLSALNLLCSYMDEGPYAVHLVLSVGIFPYVLKLLHSSFVELKKMMILIWAKILAVEPECKVDLVREKSFDYFVNALKDSSLEPEYRAMACFVLSCICHEYPLGNEACLSIELGFVCLSHLEMCPNSQPFLLQWLCLCLSRFWQGSELAISSAHRSSAHEMLYPLVNNSSPEVRASAISALSALTSQSQVSTQKSNIIGHDIMSLLVDIGKRDASPLVRREVVPIMQAFISQFEKEFFRTIARTLEDSTRSSSYANENILTSTLVDEWVAVVDTNKLNRSHSDIECDSLTVGYNGISKLYMSPSASSLNRGTSLKDLKVPASLLRNPTLSSHSNIYLQILGNLAMLTSDSCESVATLAKDLSSQISSKISLMARNILPSSADELATPTPDSQFPLSPEASFMSVPSEGEAPDPPDPSLITSGLFPSLSRYFTRPILKAKQDLNMEPFRRLYYCKRECDTRASHRDTWDPSARALQEAVEAAVSVSCSAGERSVALKFHPLECNLATAAGKFVKIYNFTPTQDGPLIPYISFNAVSSVNSRLTALEYLNPAQYPLLLTLEDNGNVRIWKDIEVFPNSVSPDENPPSIITGWRAIPSLPNSTVSKLANLKLQEATGLLFVAANEPQVHVWDLHSEMLRHTVVLPLKDNVSSLALHPTNPNLFLAGNCEGYLLLFDLRERTNFSSWSIRAHDSTVLNISMLSRSPDRVCTFSSGGEVQVSDLNTHSAINRFSTGISDLTSVAVHPCTDLTAVSSLRSSDIVFLSHLSPSFQACPLRSRVTTPAKFLRNRTNLLFHPFKHWLAASSEQETRIFSLMDGFTLHEAHILH